MSYEITVYMDTRDVSSWVRSVAWEQMDAIDRRFTIEFSAWHSFDASNRWDIFETANPANPRDELVIRNGIIPRERQRYLRIDKARPPVIKAVGYEYIWLAKRRAPNETVILGPATTNVQTDVNLALADYRGGWVGTYRVWPGVRTLHDAIKRLAAAARLHVSVRIPNYDFAPYVIDPRLSYWQAIVKLTDPFQPVRYYVRTTNTLVIADPSQPIMGAGSDLKIPAGAVSVLDVQPQMLRRIRRVHMRIPSWH
jgi:hypothetical protein